MPLVPLNIRFVPLPALVTPLRIVEVITGFRAVRETTEMLPSTARLLVHVTPPPVTPNEAPLVSGLLNSVNLSPTTKAGPGFDTVKNPVPPLVSAPLTDATSLDCGDSDLL